MDFEDLLNRAKRGDEQALEDLLNLLYDEESDNEALFDMEYGDDAEPVEFAGERYNRVFDAFRNMANAGDAFAKYAVGRLYRVMSYIRQGDGLETNAWHSEAHEWLLRAAHDDHAPALWRVIENYQEGDEGPDRDLPEAVSWYCRLAAQGEPRAFEALCGMCDDPASYCESAHIDEEEAEDAREAVLDAMRELAEDGHEGARAWLAERGQEP